MFLAQNENRLFAATKVNRVLRSRLFRGAMYVILLSLGFIFLYPLLYMVSTSLMGPEDLVSPDVYNVPSRVYLENFSFAIVGLDYFRALRITLGIAVLGALGHLVSTSLAGYGFARSRSRANRAAFVLVVFSFIVPFQTIIVPLYLQYSRFGWINSYRTLILPTFLAQGLHGALFIIVFRQFFYSIPWELEEAARIDGAGGIRIFTKLVVPLSKSAFLVVFLFSFVWHWNDHYTPSIFLRAEKTPISLRLSSFWAAVHALQVGDDTSAAAMAINATGIKNIWWANSEGIGMAACLLVIGVPLIVYLVLQRFFTEGIERTGLVD